MALLCIALACPPKCFAFRYRTAHQHAKNDYQSFSSRALPTLGSNPILIYTTKNANTHDVDICVFSGGEVKTLLNTPFFKSLKPIQNTRFSLIVIPFVAQGNLFIFSFFQYFLCIYYIIMWKQNQLF